MSIWALILRAIRQRRLSSVLTTLSVALGVMLVCAILLLQHQMDRHFREPGRGYQLVVGAPGSALQLVLNSIYHLDKSPGLMPMRIWRELAEDDSVALAVPYAVGDTFHGYRVVATTDALFARRFPHPAGEGAEKLAEGRPFTYSDEALRVVLREVGADDGAPRSGDDADEHSADEHSADEHSADEHSADEHSADEHSADEHSADEHDHEDHAVVREAVIGAEVARALRVTVGSRIEPTHGVEGTAVHEHEHLWEVVGILRETGTPVDKVVFINLDSFFAIEEHAGGATIPGTGEAALSSLLVFPRPGVHKVMLLSRLNRRPDIQIADVQEQVRHLFSIVGSVDVLFLLVSLLVVVIGVLSILVALYNSMSERRRELAILRAIGAGRRVVMGVIVGEALMLTTLGAILGLLMGHALVAASASYVESVAGFRSQVGILLPAELGVLGGVMLLGALAGLVPAWKALRTDVARNLRPLS